MLPRITTLFALCSVAPVLVAAQDKIIEKIEVRGNKIVNEEAIKSVLSNQLGQPFIQEKISSDEKNVLNLGFFKDVKIVSHEDKDKSITLSIDVLENPVIKDFKVIGNTVVSTKEILNQVIRFQSEGKIYTLRNAKQINDSISNLYYEKGYRAQVDLTCSEDETHLLVIKVIELKIGEIKIQGLTRTKEWVVRKNIKSESGQPFNAKKWSDDRRRLETTQWFESISSEGKEDSKENKLDLILDVKETSTAQFKFGVSAPIGGNPAGSFGISDTNFMGTGQTAAASTQYSVDGGWSGELDYVNPYIDQNDSALTVKLFSRVNTIFSSGFSKGHGRFSERRTGIGLAYARSLGEYLTGQVGINHEQIRTTSRNLKSNQFIRQDGSLTTLLLGAEYDTRDVAADPTEGYYASLRIEPGFGKLTARAGAPLVLEMPLGGYSFIRSSMEYKKFIPLNPKAPLNVPRHVIALRARYGLISGKAPFLEQFFLGGNEGLRGYADQRYWGKQLFSAGIEYRLPIQKALKLIFFVDAGSAWAGYGDYFDKKQSKAFNLHVGYGPGVQFDTPLGSIQVGYGFGDGRGQAFFGMGGKF